MLKGGIITMPEYCELCSEMNVPLVQTTATYAIFKCEYCGHIMRIPRDTVAVAQEPCAA